MMFKVFKDYFTLQNATLRTSVLTAHRRVHALPLTRLSVTKSVASAHARAGGPELLVTRTSMNAKQQIFAMTHLRLAQILTGPTRVHV
jgi:hypothetical protein